MEVGRKKIRFSHNCSLKGFNGNYYSSLSYAIEQGYSELEFLEQIKNEYSEWESITEKIHSLLREEGGDYDYYKLNENNREEIYSLMEILSKELLFSDIINPKYGFPIFFKEVIVGGKSPIDFNIERIYEIFPILCDELYDIITEIDNKISNISNNDTTEQDFSNNENKEKVILLEKIGIIDFIKEKQSNPNNIKQTAEILSSFTGIKSATLYSYLRPILSPHRDDTDKNSPYKNPENIQRANKTLHKLPIK